MPAISGNSQATRVQTKIAAVSASSAACCFLLPDTEFPAGISSTVATVGDLPVIWASNIPNGTIIFVDSISVPVVASDEQWIGLDGRLLRSDVVLRQIWSWGSNSQGRLGDGTVTDRSSPVTVVGGFSDWCRISAGGGHNLALRTNGTLWSWGYNFVGQLGDGTVTNRSSPVSVVGGITDWCRISAGCFHSLAIRTNGTAWSWGRNDFGRLGDGTGTNRNSPVSVIGGFTDWSKISAGGSHSLGLRSNGTLWSWGSNSQGRLGDGTVTDRSSPVTVVGGFSDWCRISAGGDHNLALRTNGTVWSWGYNGCGRLGDGTTVSRSSPVSVVGGFTDWSEISAGGRHSLALRSNGTLWAWGWNCFGQRGDGTTFTNQSSPVSVVGGFTDWSQIAAGDCHSAALRANGTVWAWGSNSQGQLGDGTTTSRSSPVSVVGGFTDWSQISACTNHSVAIRIQS